MGDATAGDVHAAAQIGDLAESVIKRSLAMKDFGTMVGPHGGMLDTFDGFLFAAPIAWFYIRFFDTTGNPPEAYTNWNNSQMYAGTNHPFGVQFIDFAPSATILFTTLPAPPRAKSSLLIETTWTGASGDMRFTSPHRYLSIITSPRTIIEFFPRPEKIDSIRIQILQ